MNKMNGHNTYKNYYHSNACFFFCIYLYQLINKNLLYMSFLASETYFHTYLISTYLCSGNMATCNLQTTLSLASLSALPWVSFLNSTFILFPRSSLVFLYSLFKEDAISGFFLQFFIQLLCIPKPL